MLKPEPERIEAFRNTVHCIFQCTYKALRQPKTMILIWQVPLNFSRSFLILTVSRKLAKFIFCGTCQGKVVPYGWLSGICDHSNVYFNCQLFQNLKFCLIGKGLNVGYIMKMELHKMVWRCQIPKSHLKRVNGPMPVSFPIRELSSEERH